MILEMLEQVVVTREEPAAIGFFALEGCVRERARCQCAARTGPEQAADSRFSFVCMERVCRLRCSERVKTLRHSSTGHAYALPLPGLSSVSLVGTGRPRAFFVRLGMATGFGRRTPRRPALARPDFMKAPSAIPELGSSKKTSGGEGGELVMEAVSGAKGSACDS